MSYTKNIKKAKLIYIISTGHSGSTLLDLITGTIPEVFSTGEITYLPWQISRDEKSGIKASKQKLCSCQSGFKECDVWTNIIQNLSIITGINLFEKPFEYTINLLGNKKYKARSYSLERFLRGSFHLLVNTKMSFIVQLYRWCHRSPISNNWLLFDTICQSLNAEFVVDSSKSIDRLNLLYNYRPEHVYVLLLKRNIRGVVYSNMKLGKNPKKTAEDWVRQYNYIYKSLKQMKGIKVLPVEYEEMAKDPATMRKEIAFFLGRKNLKKPLQINTREHHLVAGNGMRHKGLIEVKLDNKWQTALQGDLLKEIAKIEECLGSYCCC